MGWGDTFVAHEVSCREGREKHSKVSGTCEMRDCPLVHPKQTAHCSDTPAELCLSYLTAGVCTEECDLHHWTVDEVECFVRAGDTRRIRRE